MSHELSDKKLAVLGAGKLGGILLRAYLKQGLFGASRVTATVKHRKERPRSQRNWALPQPATIAKRLKVPTSFC
jgi:pyrroline-5-carboxylate reductase